MKRSGAWKRKWTAIILLGLGSAVLSAQTLPPLTADDQLGSQPFNSYHGGDIDHIGLANGTLGLEYPFLAYSQRGALQLSFHLFYNNQPQHKAERCVQISGGQSCSFVWGWTPAPPPTLPLERGDVYVGWAQQTAVYGTDTSVILNSGKSDQVQHDYARWSLQTADGAAHPLANLGTQSLVPICPGCTAEFVAQATGPWETLDATGWRLLGTLTASDGQGSEPGFPSAIIDGSGIMNAAEDPNGNLIAITRNSNGAPVGLSDTLGRQMALPPTASSPSNTDTSGCPVPPQVPLPVDHAVLWSVPGPNGGTSNYKFCYAIVAVNMPNPSAVSGNQSKLQSIVLPDGHSWSFQYTDTDGSSNGSGPINYGTLTQVMLPTGGTISYAYGTTGVGQSCQNGGRFVASRTVNANDGTGDHTWSYSYSTANTGNTASPFTVTTKVTEPSGSYVNHIFNSLDAQDTCPAYETQTQYFESGGGLLKTVNTTYSFTRGQNSKGFLNVVPTQITTVWPSGKTATVSKSYDSGFAYTDFKGGTGASGIYGKELTESVSDYGSHAAGATLRTSKTNYLAFSNSSYLNANLLDLVSSSVIQDSSGCTQAETDYVYDEPNDLTSYTGTLPAGTHGAPPSSVRGNLTSVTHELFAANSCPTSAQSGPATHTNWYDTGEVYQSTDALGNTATHSYDSAYAGAYSTQTCNTLSQCVSGTYDFNTGLLTSFTDANGSTAGDPGHTTNLEYNDPLWRVTKIQSPADPSGNNPVTTIRYPDANTVERLTAITTSMTDDSLRYFDGVGRHYKSVHASANSATVVTGYDSNGRVASITNPYFKTSDATYGTTQTQYDGLGRITQITQQDNSVVTNQYNQNAANSTTADCTLATDEAGKQRQSCVDGAGRLVEVDEPGSPSAGVHASGSLALGSIRQNTQTTAATYSQGQFTVIGTETNTETCTGGRCRTTWDTGSVTVKVGSFLSSANASQFASASSMATALQGHFNATGVGSPVTAGIQGTTVTLTAINPGPQTISITYGGTSISFSASGSSSVTGGQNAVTTTTYDAGTVTASVNGGFSATVCYGQSVNSFCSGKPVNATTDQVGAALAQALSAQGSPVTANYSGGMLNIVYATVGTAGNLPVTLSSSPDNSGMFPGGSFSGSATLGGGADSYPAGVAHPYVTLYSYDVLGNLLTVNQKGDGSQAARVRTFTYDSLSRLLTATNPESGQISYSYDANGNVLQKTSPAPNQTGAATQTISYCYDPLNRIVGKAYSAQNCPLSSPAVTYTYDSGANGIGHLTSLTDPAGSGSYGYDALGRITSESRTIAGVTQNLAYTYNLDSSVATLKYPSGAVIAYTPDAAGRSLSAVDTAGGINYITNASYGADNSLTGFISGQGAGASTFAGISNSVQYNSRLQVCRITALTTGTLPATCTDSTHTGNVFDLGYNLNLGNGDNGNVAGITNYRDTSRNQSFTYDQLNRLTSAQNAGTDCMQKTANNATKYWGNNYSYDAWGNLLQKIPTKCNAENLITVASTTNQIHSGNPAAPNQSCATSPDYLYDAAGNMTCNIAGPMAPQSYSYDAENRITGAAGYTYTYDADGNRVEKSNGTTGAIYWYMSPGIVAESDLGGNLKSEYVFFNGERVARKDFSGSTTSVSYYFSDHLKTASVITDAAGTIKEDEDYYPWGGEIQFANGDPNHYKFTGKERDVETGLDYFGARYYGNWIGRFLSADWAGKPTTVPYANFGNPQSLNLYSYTKNNPTTFGDPDGHCCLTEIEQVAQEFVDVVVKPLIESATPVVETAVGVSGSAIATGVGVVLVPAHIFAPSVGQSDADEKAAIEQASRERAAQNGGVDPQQHQQQTTQPEPQTATGGAGQRSGGGRNAQKSNQNRQQSAADQLAKAKQDLAALRSKPNKTAEEADRVKQLENQVKHLQKKAAQKSETHSRKAKGQQQ